jgi:NSS family neurotransmitter:Na+ symporter
MVLGCILSVILAGWVMPRKVLFQEITNNGTLRLNTRLFKPVLFVLRYVAPIGIIVLILSTVL